MNLITPGKLFMIVVKLAAIAKKPIISDEVKIVTIDNPQTEIKSKCFINCNLKIERYQESRNLQFQMFQDVELYMDVLPMAYPNLQ